VKENPEVEELTRAEAEALRLRMVITLKGRELRRVARPIREARRGVGADEVLALADAADRIGVELLDAVGEGAR
jgi:hypothetical protein